MMSLTGVVIAGAMGAIMAAPMNIQVQQHNQERSLKLVSSGNQKLNEHDSCGLLTN